MEQLKHLIRLMSLFKSIATGCDRFEVLETYELEIAKRFLMCPYFEKRIKGMKEFKFIQEKVLNRLLKNVPERRQAQLPCAQFLDMKSFSHWIIENKVMDFIFKEKPHSELIKRSYSILYLMAQDAETFPDEMVSMIWSCCSSEKHEDIVRATYELITELARHLPHPRLQSMF